MEQKIRSALLVGLDTGRDPGYERSMQELERLAETAGILVLGTIVQKRSRMDGGHYLGTGKREELAARILEETPELVIFNDELTPMQVRNLEQDLLCPVMDRTMLILDIFARRARTREAALQVEIASLQYMLPRLTGYGITMSRQTAGSGLHTRGAGETKLELDRRVIGRRIRHLKRELDQLVVQRKTRRSRRRKNDLPVVSLVGYTNAGKSTVMNALVSAWGQREDALVHTEDLLFATVETAVRRIVPGPGRTFLLTDTVGFVSRLPHGLIKAFRSTLEEVTESDLLLHVVDLSDPEHGEHIQVTENTLREIGVRDVPVLYVYNKTDLTKYPEPRRQEGKIFISAREGEGIGLLREAIVESLFPEPVRMLVRLPYREGPLAGRVRAGSRVLREEYQEDGLLLELETDPRLAARLEAYKVQTKSGK